MVGSAVAATAVCPRGRPEYRRREPEKGILYAVVEEHLEKFLAETREKNPDGSGLPHFVEEDFRKFLGCGRLDRGFVRLACEACGQERLVAFSCHGRGFCPSCLGRRMRDVSLHLVDRVLPLIPYRQWVVTWPGRLRHRLAFDARLHKECLRIAVRSIFAWQRRQARKLGLAKVEVGALSFAQRFAVDLLLYPHAHLLVPDGVFVEGQKGEAARFHKLAKPSAQDIEAVATRIVRLTLALLLRRGVFTDWDTSGLPLPQALVETEPARVHRAVRETEEERRERLCVIVEGFSLEARTRVHEHDREGLSRLCRYGLRPPVANDRLERTRDGQVVVRFKRERRDGATSVTLTPMEFLRRLALQVPPPRSPLLGYHGVFAGRAKFRAHLAPGEPEEFRAKKDAPPAGDETLAPGPPFPEDGQATLHGAFLPPDEMLPLVPAPLERERYLDWGSLLYRTFGVEGYRCGRCGGSMRVVEVVTDEREAAAILDRLRKLRHPP